MKPTVNGQKEMGCKGCQFYFYSCLHPYPTIEIKGKMIICKNKKDEVSGRQRVKDCLGKLSRSDVASPASLRR